MREINKTEHRWKAIRVVEYHGTIWELNVYGAQEEEERTERDGKRRQFVRQK